MNIKKHIVRATVVVVLAIVTAPLLYPRGIAHSDDEIVITDIPQPTLTHQQKVWMYALEWCESNGINSAINPNDLDNTPSYGAFQFKPSTLDFFAKKYGVATTTVMDYEVQRKVVEQMVLHRDEIKWQNQFPWCVKKLGRPPR